ncbi:methyltransferase domain-containing protein [Pseudaminobacter sp. NGMCC 1.201702]|uniref:methyltransferase domain-containing protein n=1 Tax=Pseudaminobacter sp. NGMCC 1.201702 TaxID=3391825 RepID=UPI0039F0AEDC
MFSNQQAADAATVAYNPYTDRGSLEFKFRSGRFVKIRQLIETILAERGEARILDIGGTQTYWLIGEEFLRQHRNRIKITLVNTEVENVTDTRMFDALVGDGADPDLFGSERFDLVHSNSVIEHVGSWERMRAFAENTKRLAPRSYVQTPNYWFPLEPHFRFAGFQYLPECVRIALIMRYSLGFFRRIEDFDEARDIIDHHTLISTRQVRKLFADAQVSHEKFLGFNKSIIAIRS